MIVQDFSCIDTLLFDLDGTLVDSVPDILAILQEMNRNSAMPELNREAVEYWSSRGGLPMIQALLGCKENEAESLLTEFRLRYMKRPTDPASLFPSVYETLSTLYKDGFKMALCTNKPTKLAKKILDELSIDVFFKTILCGDSLASKKPDPAILNEAMRVLGSVSQNTLMIGDSTIDQKAAVSAGVKFCFFVNGYDDGVNTEQAHLSVNQLSELSQILGRN